MAADQELQVEKGDDPEEKVMDSTSAPDKLPELQFPDGMPEYDTGIFCTRQSFEKPLYDDMHVASLGTVSRKPLLSQVNTFLTNARQNSDNMEEWVDYNFNTNDELFQFVNSKEDVDPSWNETVRDRFNNAKNIIAEKEKKDAIYKKLLGLSKSEKRLKNKFKGVERRVSSLCSKYRAAQKKEFLARQTYADFEYTLTHRKKDTRPNENDNHDARTMRNLKRQKPPKKEDADSPQQKQQLMKEQHKFIKGWVQTLLDHGHTRDQISKLYRPDPDHLKHYKLSENDYEARALKMFDELTKQEHKEERPAVLTPEQLQKIRILFNHAKTPEELKRIFENENVVLETRYQKDIPLLERYRKVLQDLQTNNLTRLTNAQRSEFQKLISHLVDPVKKVGDYQNIKQLLEQYNTFPAEWTSEADKAVLNQKQADYVAISEWTKFITGNIDNYEQFSENAKNWDVVSKKTRHFLKFFREQHVKPSEIFIRMLKITNFYDGVKSKYIEVDDWDTFFF